MGDPFDLAARRAERIARQYRELKAADPEAYRECVEIAHVVVDKHHAELSEALQQELRADIEIALVGFAHRRIGV